MTAALNIADAYVSVGGLDSATKYATIALDLAKETKYLVIHANALNTLGKIYTSKNQLAQAEDMVIQSMAIRKKIGNPYYVVADQVQLSDIYFRMGKFEKSKSNALTALQLAQENKIETQDYAIYTTLFNSFYGNGEYKSAADYGRQIIDILYANSNKMSAEAFAELEVKYETAKKEQQIQEQQFEIEKKNTTIMVTVIVIILICLLGFIIFQFLRYQQKQKLQAIIIKEQDDAARAVISAEEHERSRMSQTLHDGVGQLLSGLKMNLGALEERVNFKEHQSIFQKSIALLDESIAETRSVSHQILPNNIIRMGLGNALKSLIEKIDQDKVEISLSVDGMQKDILPDTQLMVYRIIQESVHNAMKHANAQNIDIAIHVKEQILSAQVSDNGIGFDSEILKKESGIGLGNIATRIRFLKGTYSIKSKINQGTTLAFEVPLN